MIVILLFLAGLLIALISSSLGIGGGIFTVPVLIFSARMIPIPDQFAGVQAVAGSLLMAFIFSLSASYRNHKNRTIQWHLGALLTVGAVPGAVLGSTIAIQLKVQQLILIFAFFLTINGLYTLFKKPSSATAEEDDGAILTPGRMRVLSVIPIGVLIGMISSLTGIGGGVFMVPLFMHLYHQTPRQSVATSSFCITIISMSGALAYLWQGLLISTADIPDPHIGYYYLPLILPLLVGGLAGGYMGAHVSYKLPARLLRFLLGVLQLLVAARLIFESVSGLLV
ncbi:MAG: sulfite exporter TauE/SafE family protein [Leptospiraceae bacterium]|nr:sulfite exporter TauE/SafE family protein [Leptospiraceae bacterium]